MECPVCHISNHDQARFCEACGQRLAIMTPAPDNPPGSITPTDRPGPGKLRSPLLAGPYEDIEPELPPPSSSESMLSNRLHSPLLHGQDRPFSSTWSPPTSDSGLPRESRRDDLTPTSPPNQGKPSPSSPLSSKKPPVLGAPEKRVLHSPLLEPQVDEVEAEPPILPNVEEYEALRSPLLAARIPFPDESGNLHLEARPVSSASAPQTQKPAPVTPPSTPVTPSVAVPQHPPLAGPPATAVVPSTHVNQIRSSVVTPPAIPHEPKDEPSIAPSVIRQTNFPPVVLALLSLAALLNIWLIGQYWGQALIFMNQAAQLLIIISLAYLCSGGAPGTRK